MLKIYGSDVSTPSNKVRFVLHLLDRPYEYVSLNLQKGEHRSKEFLQLSALGKVPVMKDDEFVLFESGAIAKFLIRESGSSLYPEDRRQQAVIDQWNDFVTIHVQGAMGRIFYNRVVAPAIGADEDQASIAAGVGFLKRYLPFLDQRFEQSSFLAGDSRSLADVGLLSSLDPAEVSGVDLSAYPALQDWRARHQEESFYTRCHRNFEEALREQRQGS